MTITERLVKLGLTEEQAKKVSDSFGTVVDGLYVTKERFNEVNTELKTANATIKERDDQLETIKTSNEDSETLKATIKQLQADNKAATEKANADLMQERKNNAIKLELTGKVHNMDITLSQLKMDEIVMGEDGKVKSGLKEQIDGLKKSDNYLFKPEDGADKNPTNPAFIKGASPKDGDGKDGSGEKLSTAEVFAKNLAQTTVKAAGNEAISHYFGEN